MTLNAITRRTGKEGVVGWGGGEIERGRERERESSWISTPALGHLRPRDRERERINNKNRKVILPCGV